MQQHPTPFVHRIKVDDRERSPEVVEALRRLGANIEVGRLQYGDYVVEGHLFVERKTIRDLAVSVMSGRLFRQARRLASLSTGRACIIIEGPPHDLLTGGLSRSGFHGTLISLTLVFGLPVLRSTSPQETASLILLAADQLRRRLTAPPRRYGRRIGSLRRSQMLMLQGIPSVGPGRATSLLESFGSPGSLASASVDEIAEVPGIGKCTAGRIWTVMHRRPDGATHETH